MPVIPATQEVETEDSLWGKISAKPYLKNKLKKQKEGLEVWSSR
jgi:hypothetical protein